MYHHCYHIEYTISELFKSELLIVFTGIWRSLPNKFRIELIGFINSCFFLFLFQNAFSPALRKSRGFIINSDYWGCWAIEKWMHPGVLHQSIKISSTFAALNSKWNSKFKISQWTPPVAASLSITVGKFMMAE